MDYLKHLFMKYDMMNMKNQLKTVDITKHFEKEFGLLDKNVIDAEIRRQKEYENDMVLLYAIIHITLHERWKKILIAKECV